MYFFIKGGHITRAELEAANRLLALRAERDKTLADRVFTEEELDVLMSGSDVRVTRYFMSAYAVWGEAAAEVCPLRVLLAVTPEAFLERQFSVEQAEALVKRLEDNPVDASRYAAELAHLRELSLAFAPDPRLLSRYLPCALLRPEQDILEIDGDALERLKETYAQTSQPNRFLGNGNEGLGYYLGSPDAFPTLYFFIKHGVVSKEKLLLWNDRSRADETVNRELILTDTMISILFSGDDNEVRRTFVSPNACYENGRIYAVYDLYFMDAVAFAAAGIPKSVPEALKNKA